MARAPYPRELESCPWGITPKPGREYIIAPACCGQCSATQRGQEGHFACSFQADDLMKEGWHGEDCQLTESGWEAVLSREVAQMARLTLAGSLEALVRAVLAAYPNAVIDEPYDGGYSADSDYTTKKVLVDGKETGEINADLDEEVGEVA